MGTAGGVWQELGERVFRRRYRFLDQNIGLVLGDDAALVIDTRSTHRHAEELQTEIRAVTALPVRIVVDTHGHWDHCFGNAAFRGAAIWAQSGCVAFMERTAEPARTRIAAAFPEIADDIRAVEILPPDKLFADAAIVHVGGRAVELRYLGRGHTDHDVVVSVPDAGVTFAGDLIEEGSPPWFGDSYPLDWPGALAALMTGLTATVIPGHGDVVDPTYVRGQHQEIEALAGLARQAIRDAEPLEVAATRGPYPVEVSLLALERAAAQLDEVD